MKIPSVSRNIPFLFPLFCFKCSGTSPNGPHTSSFEGLTGQCPGTPAWPPRPRELTPGGAAGRFALRFRDSARVALRAGAGDKAGGRWTSKHCVSRGRGTQFLSVPDTPRRGYLGLGWVWSGTARRRCPSGPGARRLPQALSAAASSSSPGGVPGAPPSAPLVLRRGIYTRVL